MTAEEVARALHEKPKRAMGGWLTRCPSHPDDGPSLHVWDTSDGRGVTHHCYGNCQWERVAKKLEEMGLRDKSFSPEQAREEDARRFKAVVPIPESVGLPPERDHPHFGKHIKTWHYRAADGSLICGESRYEKDGKKALIPRSYCRHEITGREGWFCKAPGVMVPLYNSHLMASRPGDTVGIVEGAKCADAANELAPEIVWGAWMGGSERPRMADWSVVEGRDVILPADNDEAGWRAMQAAGQACYASKALSITLVDPRGAGLPAKFDVADARDAGWTAEAYSSFIEKHAVAFVPTPAAEGELRDNTITEKRGSPGVRYLGYDKGEYYYLSEGKRQIINLSASAHTKNNLYSIVDNVSFWIGLAGPSDKGNSFNMEAATAEIMRRSRMAGLFDVEKIRGRGSWWDDGRIVLHLGDRLIVDGAERDLADMEGGYFYEAKVPFLSGPADTQATDAECAAIIEASRGFWWAKEHYHELAVGWIALAPICGLLDWRSHLWITGERGSGKSLFLDELAEPLLAEIRRRPEGGSTEAGIRQMLGSEAMGIIWDESEPGKTDKARERLDAALAYIRSSSTEKTGSEVMRGGKDGQAIGYRPRSMFCLASIVVNLENDANRSRFCVVSMKHPTAASKTSDMRDFMKLLGTVGTPLMGRKLLARTSSMVPAIRENIALMREALIEVCGVTPRTADQVGALLAGCESLRRTRAMTPEESVAVAERHRHWLAEDGSENSETSASRCLAHLLQHPIRVEHNNGTVERPVAEVAACAAKDGAMGSVMISERVANETLGRYGMKVRDAVLYVGRSHTAIKRIYGGTEWEHDPGSMLATLPFAKTPNTSANMRFGSLSAIRAVGFPMEEILGKDRE